MVEMEFAALVLVPICACNLESPPPQACCVPQCNLWQTSGSRIILEGRDRQGTAKPSTSDVSRHYATVVRAVASVPYHMHIMLGPLTRDSSHTQKLEKQVDGTVMTASLQRGLCAIPHLCQAQPLGQRSAKRAHMCVCMHASVRLYKYKLRCISNV